MKITKNGSLVNVGIDTMMRFGEVLDPRIDHIERIVAEHYTTTVHELDVFYRDSEAKIMCCLLLHDVLQYDIRALAKKYHIDAGFLVRKINDLKARALTDNDFLKVINGLKLKSLDMSPGKVKVVD